MTASSCWRNSASGRSFVLRCALAAALLGAAAAHAQVPTFTGVGDLPGGLASSAALDVSANGGVVVGESESTAGTQAFRWTPAGGIAGLGFLPSSPKPFSTANGVSANGNVVVGTSTGSDGVDRAYRWSSGTLTALNRFTCADCDPITKGWGVSNDGLVAVGSALARGGGSDPPHLDPVRWPGGGTGISDLGNLSGPSELGEAFGASPTGSIIVGNHLSNFGRDAFRWQGSGLVALARLIGGSVIAANAFAVSDNGTTIVGYSNAGTLTLPGGTVVPSDLQAVRWTGTSFGTISSLGAFPGAVNTDSEAFAVSADGAIIIGRAAGPELDDHAFVWTAATGMRDLKAVLMQEYGLDLDGWQLSEARGISNVVSGDYTIVGNGINPDGEPEGFVAFLSIPACDDGEDNDGDSAIDHPADGGCTSPVDWSESFDCADGIDNDGDGQIDFAADAGCTSASDATEKPDCSDGIDNDGDGFADHPQDPGCQAPSSPIENPACQNGSDDDFDGNIDHPADLQCTAPFDRTETPDCNDGIDNDGDAAIDFPADAQCESPADLSESTQCSDGLDNDGDGQVDFPAQYPGCVSANDPIEAAQCGDGVDNDGDLAIDFPADTGCTGANGQSESPVNLFAGGLFAVDRTSGAVFRVDTVSGAQTLVSQGARLTAPQGIAARVGELVVADPAGLVAVAGTGVQRLASPPLASGESLQVALDAALDAYVLEASAVSKVLWNPFGIGSKSAFLPIPTPEPIPFLSNWNGDALALEANGNLLVTGLSLLGDGVFRVTNPGAAVSILKIGFDNVKWLDLALEASGTIVAVGSDFDVDTGVFRIHPTTGAITPLNIAFAWQTPTGVAVAPDGQIYVGDAGSCSGGTCTGGKIVRVNPTSGAATQLSTGGLIAGELDLVALPEPGAAASWLAGIAALLALRRLREPRRPR
jgi:probable HAF family extracellular repeat protein